MAGIVLAGLCGAGCTTPVIDPAAHPWGTYGACLRRLSDDCRAPDADAGCVTTAALTRSLTLGVRADGTFLWSRDGLAAAEGRQVGSHFELRTSRGSVATLCGCTADVEEVIRGELLEASGEEAVDCTPADGGAGCGAGAGRPSAFFDGGLPGEGWLEAVDGGVDTRRAYPSFRAVVTDEAVAGDGGGCGCLPCRVVFEATGRK